jgi:hypothetical protein
MKSQGSLFILSLLVLICSKVQSQDFYTIFSSEVEYSPKNSYTYEPANSVNFQENNTDLNLPLPRKNGDAILFGIGAQKFRPTANFVEEPITVDTVYSSTYQFYRYRLQAGYSKKWNEDFSTVIMVMGRVSSDMIEGIQPNIFQYGGLVLFTKKRSEIITYKYGVYMNTEFFGLFIVPLFGVDWKMSDKWRAFGVLPASMYLQYSLNKSFRTGLMFKAPTNTYRVSEESLDNPNNDRISTYVHYQTNNLYVYLDCYLTKSIVFTAKVGRTVFRGVRLYASDDVYSFNISGIGFGGTRQPIPVPVYRDFADGWLLNASIAYRFSLE